MTATQTLKRWIVSRFCPLSVLDWAAMAVAALGLLDEVLRWMG